MCLFCSCATESPAVKSRSCEIEKVVSVAKTTTDGNAQVVIVYNNFLAVVIIDPFIHYF